MKIDVDARGLACPQPVINTKKALDSIEEGTVITVVDNAVARDNVAKLTQSLGCQASVEEQAGLYTITITKGAGGGETVKPAQTGVGPVVFVTQEYLGQGSEELGKILIKSFFFTLVESQDPPKAIMFANGGVKLTCSGSPVVDHLQLLAEQGTEVLSCGTCLDYFGLKEQLQVGQITNMYTILENLKQGVIINI